MKNVMFILSFVLVIFKFSCYGQKDSVLSCGILEVIIYTESIYTVLGLDNASSFVPHIRIADLTSNFRNCQGFYKAKLSGQLIPYRVTNKIMPDINTGHFRDVILSKLQKTESEIRVLVYLSSFETHNNINESYAIESIYKFLECGDMILLGSKIFEWHDKPDAIDYETIGTFKE